MWRIGLALIVGCGFSPGGASGSAAPGVDAPRADGDAALDARPTSCLAAYDIDLGTSSRYRLVTDVPDKVRDAFDDCADDQLGATHLVAIDDMSELLLLDTAIASAGFASAQFWIGGAQRGNVNMVGTAWISITGGDLFTFWGPKEPNDGDGGDPPYHEDHSEDFVVLESAGYNDQGAGHSNAYICECDGKAIDGDARDLFHPP